MMRFLKQLFGSTAESPEAHLRQGVAFLREKKYGHAVAAFTNVIRLDPANAHAYRWRAQAYAALGDAAKADADDNRVQELDVPVAVEKPVMPVMAKAMLCRTTNYESEADCDQVIRDITEAPAWVRDNNPPAFHNRGFAFFQKGDYQRAIEDFTEAIRLCPTTGESYLPLRMRGLALLRAGKYREAIADFTQVLTLEPSDVYVYGCRGAAYNELAEYDRAIADCTEAIRLDPGSLLAHASRGFSYLKKREFAQSIADYSHAIQLDQGNPALYEGRATAYRAFGDLDSASADNWKAQELRWSKG
ncbi:MAG TPA: tetratricopeptide repeat protein [Gemmataceae bacterium]|jgi:tetratricopeptide (TPR) repeat protein|nr:tetratricopeptide repeat protein [Gemmataceae bacterium]